MFEDVGRGLATALADFAECNPLFVFEECFNTWQCMLNLRRSLQLSSSSVRVRVAGQCAQGDGCVCQEPCLEGV